MGHVLGVGVEGLPVQGARPWEPEKGGHGALVTFHSMKQIKQC